jgi:hypothetical protein
MFANEMVEGCGINAWESNSRVVRASTADLNQPFEVEAEIKGPFGSEPSLARIGDDWLLYSIGNKSSTKPPRPDCSQGYTPKGPAPNGTGGNFHGYVPVEVAVSSAGVAGPYVLNSTVGNGDFNPSPFVFPNGTTLLMWRHLARVHLVTAPSWAGPFLFNGSDGSCNITKDPSSAKRPGCAGWHLFGSDVDARLLEDPFIYSQPMSPPSDLPLISHQQPHGGADGGGVTYHALFHDHKSFGGHAFSRDGLNWTFSSTSPYSNVVNFTDGSSVAMQRRERPHLAFDANGFISHLSTGAQPPPTSAKAPPSNKFNNDYVYTLLQPVHKQHAMTIVEGVASATAAAAVHVD